MNDHGYGNRLTITVTRQQSDLTMERFRGQWKAWSTALILSLGLIFPAFVTTATYSIDHNFQYIVTEDYYVSITPVRTKSYYYAFRLIIKNQTKEDLWINWNKTEYIVAENPNGGFMFDGVDYPDRAAAKPLDKVPANDIFIKTIWPNALVERNKDWSHLPLESGLHGIDLTIVGNKGEFKEKLLLSIVVQEP
jgi:hypothetical protein